MHFAETLPVDMPLPVLLTDVVSRFESELEPPSRPMSTLGPTTLSPSLLSDLQRFSGDVTDTDLLPVLAAAVRHATPLIMQLQLQGRIVALSVLPRDQQFKADLDLCALPAEEMSQLRLLHVGPMLSSESHAEPDPPALHVGGLSALLWRLALHGARDELLPEIAGPVRYRLAPGVPLRSLPMEAWSLPILHGLRREASTLHELAPRTLLERQRARRLLNAVYLQGRLMVTRSLPMQRRPSTTRRTTS